MLAALHDRVLRVERRAGHVSGDEHLGKGVNALITFSGKDYTSATITIRNTTAAISLQK